MLFRSALVNAVMDGTRPARVPAADRREDYAFLRDQGEDVEEAARRVGVTAKHARDTYEPKLRETAS